MRLLLLLLFGIGMIDGLYDCCGYVVLGRCVLVAVFVEVVMLSLLVLVFCGWWLVVGGGVWLVGDW